MYYRHGDFQYEFEKGIKNGFHGSWLKEKDIHGDCLVSTVPLDAWKVGNGCHCILCNRRPLSFKGPKWALDHSLCGEDCTFQGFF